MGPRVLGLAAVQLNFWINTVLASTLPEGSLSALNYAWLLMLLPQGVIAQGIATAAFPTFAALEARGQYRELRRMLSSTLRGIVFLTIPAMAGLIIWRVPLIRMLLERGEFTAYSTELTAHALLFYGWGLLGHSMVEVVSRAFYALHDTRTPVAIGIGAMLVNALLSLLLRPLLAHGGLALANTIATILETVLLLWLLSRRLNGLEWPQLAATGLRSLAAAGIMSLPLVWAARRMWSEPVWIVACLGLLVAAVLYLVSAIALRMPEIGLLRQMARR
jgi:putative peptidoglycan lipid II flippase